LKKQTASPVIQKMMTEIFKTLNAFVCQGCSILKDNPYANNATIPVFLATARLKMTA
jgi:hypothetical protein